jgi:hypothetical protein
MAIGSAEKGVPSPQVSLHGTGMGLDASSTVSSLSGAKGFCIALVLTAKG